MKLIVGYDFALNLEQLLVSKDEFYSLKENWGNFPNRAQILADNGVFSDVIFR